MQECKRGAQRDGGAAGGRTGPEGHGGAGGRTGTEGHGALPDTRKRGIVDRTGDFMSLPRQ
eukprot:scaffold33992_cov31-Tisochrysis_lutea.AAC.6